MDIEAIRKLYRSSAIARAAFEHFAAGKKNMTETSVNRLLAVLAAKGHNAGYGEVRDFLMELGNLNCGKYIQGRKGWPSRLKWSVGMVSLGQAATGKDSSVEELNETEAVDETQDAAAAQGLNGDSDITVSYPLRPEREVEFALPKDLTTREAQRLADFIKTLPFEGAA